MSVAAVDSDSRWEILLRTWRELDVPDGWRAEIIGEGIGLVPPPKDSHNDIVEDIQAQLYAAIYQRRTTLPTCGLHQAADVRLPMICELYVPDLVVLPKPLRSRGDEHSAEDAFLVVEVTSRNNGDTDRKIKRWGYAHGPVPLYLLVDRWDPEAGAMVTLFSEPANGVYQNIHRVPFGDPIALPDPFGMALETAEFPREE